MLNESFSIYSGLERPSGAYKIIANTTTIHGFHLTMKWHLWLKKKKIMNSCANQAVHSFHKHEVPTLCHGHFLDMKRETK